MLTDTIITDEESLIDSFQVSNYKKVEVSRKTEFSSIRAGGGKKETANEVMLSK